MLNKLLAFIRQYRMVESGDTVICAVSGGADSVALLWAMYLLRDKLQITLAAAHFNHHLRGEESQRDEQFVQNLCADYNIPLYLGSGTVTSGEKGLEAAARDARYAFLRQLPGKIATAHTADDNAETVLMHMVRGSGLKGLGGITPVRNGLIRPMLSVTRQEVMAFLDEYSMACVQDSSNDSDQFFRNRLRHHVMPLMAQENPRIAQNLSAMALRLREDEQLLNRLAQEVKTADIERLRLLSAPLRSRVLGMLLEDYGVREPSGEHIALLEDVVFSESPSARASFPGGIIIGRSYGILEKQSIHQKFCVVLNCPGKTELPELGLRVICTPKQNCTQSKEQFFVLPKGDVIVRSRLTGDKMRLPGGTKSLKKLFIDKKIPAAERCRIPVVADSVGVLGVYGFGVNLDRVGLDTQGVSIRFETVKNEYSED